MVVRKITTSTGIIRRIAGDYRYYGFAGDGGQATSAVFNAPLGLALDSTGWKTLFLTLLSSLLVILFS